MAKVIASPNIAFIKYWGKLPSFCDDDRNIGTNASISMTLQKAFTQVHVEKLRGTQSEIHINGKIASENDSRKMLDQAKRVLSFFDIDSHDLGIYMDSQNNFPMGTGLASSASAFAALSLAVAVEFAGLDAAKELLTTKIRDYSILARRGSGSACRSVGGPFMKWEGLSADTLECDWKLKDSILIFSSAPKLVSSSEGHERALSSPYFSQRLEKLPERILKVEKALKAKNLNILGPLLEEEARELHHIAQSSNVPIDYLTPETRRFLEELEKTQERSFFYTLDAGPNVHLISEKDIGEEVREILNRCKLNIPLWLDETGPGPQILYPEEGPKWLQIFQMSSRVTTHAANCIWYSNTRYSLGLGRRQYGPVQGTPSDLRTFAALRSGSRPFFSTFS